jgi:dipeptidyl aminopeptidase/acylaminoacyl peptidase
MALIAVLGMSVAALTLGEARGVAAEPLPAGAVARLGSARFANVGRVFAVAFTPDSKTLASASWDGDIRLWDVATRKEVRRFSGHDGPVSALRLSADGKRLLSMGHDGNIRRWDVADGKEVRPRSGTNGLGNVLLSPDGATFASWGWQPRQQALSVHVWDTTSGKEPRKLVLEPGTRPIAISQDNKRLAGVLWLWPLRAQDPSIHILDLATGKEVQRPVAVERGLNTAVFSPDGHTLAVGSYRSLRLVELLTGKDRSSIPQAEANMHLVFSADGRMLVSAGGGNQIRVWEVATGQERCRFENPFSGEFGLAISPDGRYLASGGLDVEVILWDLAGVARREARGARPDELPALWKDLESADAGRAYRALWRLAAAGDACVAYVRGQVSPVRAADADQVARLLTALDDNQFAAREKAARQLEALGDAAIPFLRTKLAARSPSLELRRRLERLLEKTDEPNPHTRQGVRAVEMLERVGTPQARQVLQALAQGVPEARLTREAKAALGRASRTPPALGRGLQTTPQRGE